MRSIALLGMTSCWRGWEVSGEDLPGQILSANLLIINELSFRAKLGTESLSNGTSSPKVIFLVYYRFIHILILNHSLRFPKQKGGGNPLQPDQF